MSLGLEHTYSALPSRFYARVAETLLPQINADTGKAVELATAAVKDFMPVFDAQLLIRMRRKIEHPYDDQPDREEYE